jgi:hypothetical protein
MNLIFTSPPYGLSSSGAHGVSPRPAALARFRVTSGRHRPRVRGIEAWLVLVPFSTARLGVVTRFGLRVFIS